MAYNQSDQLFEQSTDTNGNFANSVSGQTNSFFMPSIYSKKVLNFFRKSSVIEVPLFSFKCSVRYIIPLS